MPSPAELSSLDADAFVTALDGIFEHSPWVARRAHAHGPFADLPALQTALLDAMWAAEPQEQLALLCAHPELAGKAAVAGELTAESREEQRGAGLDRCTPEEFARLQTLNARYRERFGFPFIIAVRGLGRADILAALEARVEHDHATELRTALEQVGRIASLRLQALFAPA